MTILLLVRHAPHADLGRRLTGRGDAKLTEAGAEAAAFLGRSLRGAALARVYTSPRMRAQQTARLIASETGIDAPIDDSRLDEIDFGAWSGCDFETLDRDPAWITWNASRGIARTEAGDTMASVQERTSIFIDDLRGAHDGAPIAAVTHAEVIKAIVAKVLGFSCDNWARFEIAPASVTTLRLDRDSTTLLGLNARAQHLWAEAP